MESVFPWLNDHFVIISSVSCVAFLMFCCHVLRDIVSLVLLLVVIVWLNSEFFSFDGY